MFRAPFIVLVLLVVNVTMRFFTNGIGILPRILNVADIGIVGLLGLLLIKEWTQGHARLLPSVVVRRVVLFVAVAIIGTLLNLKYFNPKASLSQMLMLLEPLVLFVAIVSLQFYETDIRKFCKVLYALILIEVAIGLLQFPKYVITRESEALMGTFQHNAEQYAAFLLIGVCYFLGLRKLRPNRARHYTMACVGIGILILCIDNKASWLGLVITLVAVLKRLGTLSARGFRSLLAVGAIVVLCAMGYLVTSKVSGTLYKYQNLVNAIKDGKAPRLGKIKAYVDIFRSHTENLHMMFVGSGPSTFYSRACRQFYLSPRARAKMYQNPGALAEEREEGSASSKRSARTGNFNASNSMGGVIQAITARPYYDKYYGELNQIFAIGTAQVDSPYSPYAGLLGETGIIGFVLYLSIYWLALKKLSSLLNPTYVREFWFPLAAAAYGFCIYLLVNSIYGPFIETTRYTTILFSFVGVLIHAQNLTHKRFLKEERADENEPEWQASPEEKRSGVAV